MLFAFKDSSGAAASFFLALLVLSSKENPLVTVELIIEQQIKSEGSKTSTLSACHSFKSM